MAQCHRGVAAGDPLRERPRFSERLAQDEATAAVGHGHQGVDGGGVLGESSPATRHLGSDRLWDTTLEQRPARRGSVVAWRHRTGALGRGLRRVGPVHPAGGVDDRAPSRATTQVGEQGSLHGGVVGNAAARLEAGQSHDDPRRAEAALAGALRREGVGPRVAHGGVEALEGRHLPTGHASGRGDTGHPRRSVDPDRATPALALGAAPVFGRAATQTLSQDLEKRCAVVGDLDVDPVDTQ